MNKIIKRLLSSFVCIVMLFTLLPSVALATDGDNSVTIGVMHYLIDEDGNTIDKLVPNQVPDVSYDIDMPTSATFGANITVPIPTNNTISMDADGYRTTYTLTGAGSFYFVNDADDNGIENKLESLNQNQTVTIPETTWNNEYCLVYYWTFKSKEKLPDITNSICPDPQRVVKQNNVELTAIPDSEGTDIYTVSGRDNVTVGYTLSMDMRALGAAFMQDTEIDENNKDQKLTTAWNMLCSARNFIHGYNCVSEQTDKKLKWEYPTYVDMSITFDKKVDVSTVNFSNVSLDSDMFILVPEGVKYRTADGTEITGPYTVYKGTNTVVFHAFWQLQKDTMNLEPMIYLNNVQVPISSDWSEDDNAQSRSREPDTIQIVNSGNVSGMVACQPERTAKYFTIDGGSAEDKFKLQLVDSALFISKTVEGKKNDNTEFEFKIDGISGNLRYTGSDETTAFKSGDTIKLTSGNSAVITSTLPDTGTTYTITEKAVDNYTTTYTTTGVKNSTSTSSQTGVTATGTLAKNDIVGVHFTNTYTGSTGGGGGGGTTTQTVKLSYESNGGTKYDDETYTKGVTATLDKVPTRVGYQFTGWYANKDLTEKITSVKMDSDKTVYAGWRVATVPDMLNGDDHFAYVVGYPDGTVKPSANVSRAETAAIFFRLLNPSVRESNLTSKNTFKDVKAGTWCNTSIATMQKLGIVAGRDNNKFEPDAPITRAEFAAICARFDTGLTQGASNFPDIKGHWAEKEIERAVSLGWISGGDDGKFYPDKNISRAEAMSIINRVLCRLPENESDLLSGMNVWPDNKPGTWYYLAVQEATNSHDCVHKGEIYEKWTKMTEDPDWFQYSH